PLLIIDSKGWLGWQTDNEKSRFSLYGSLNTKRWTAYDASGSAWRVLPDSFPYPDVWWTRLLANTIYNPRFHAELRWQHVGAYAFEELQERICALVDKDDDILTQFIESEPLKKVVRGCTSFDQLTHRLRKMRIIRE